MTIGPKLSGTIGVVMMIMMHDDLSKTVEANRPDDYDDDDDDCA